jgi:hypothetical protein
MRARELGGVDQHAVRDLVVWKLVRACSMSCSQIEPDPCDTVHASALRCCTKSLESVCANLHTCELHHKITEWLLRHLYDSWDVHIHGCS